MPKVQYNPNTGKVQYNPNTGKVLIAITITPGNECADCLPELTPAQITVTFAGIGSCGCIFFGPDINDGWINLGANFETAINDTWTPIPQTGNPCIWEATFAGVIPIDWYTSTGSGCDVLRTTQGADLKITVNVSAATIVASVYYDDDDASYHDWLSTFFGDLNPDSGHCIKESNIASVHECGALSAAGGTATIIEI